MINKRIQELEAELSSENRSSKKESESQKKEEPAKTVRVVCPDCHELLEFDCEVNQLGGEVKCPYCDCQFLLEG